MNDIDFGGIALTPVAPDTDPAELGGFQGTPFTGVFDGNGHVLRNATINMSGTAGQDYVGLFGYLGNGGQISNLGVENVNISGGDYVGGLLGINSGTITSCYTTGWVTGNGDDVGGLVGNNWGTITSCYATGAVTGGDYSKYVGGLVGVNVSSGIITSCYAAGSVMGSFRYVGGLAGINYGMVTSCYATGTTGSGARVGGLVGDNFGTITSCYATGAMTGNEMVGGLVGVNYNGTITSCYATGAVTGDNYSFGGLVGGNNDEGTITGCYATGSVISTGILVGGLVGQNSGTITDCYAAGTVEGDWCGGLVGHNNRGEIIYCYSTGKPTGTSNVGGLCGSKTMGGNYEDTGNFWDTDTSEMTTSAMGVGKTTLEMKTQSTFDADGWDFVDTWWMPMNDYPRLGWQFPEGPTLGGVVISPAQSYVVDANDLEMSGKVFDTLNNDVTDGTFMWTLRDVEGVGLSSGNLTYFSGAEGWQASKRFLGGLNPGNYTVHYAIITDQGRTGTAVGGFTVPGIMAVIRGTITDATSGGPLEGVTVHLYDAYEIWQMAKEHFNGFIPSLTDILTYVVPVREDITDPNGFYEWTDISASPCYVVYADKSGYLPRHSVSFPVAAENVTIIKDMSLPDAVNALAALWPEVIGDRNSLEERAEDALNINANRIAEMADRINKDELFKFDPNEIGLGFLKKAYNATGTGIADEALLKPGVEWISKNLLEEIVIQVLKNRLVKWGGEEIFKQAAKFIGTLIEQSISGQVVGLTEAYQYRESVLFDKADENMATAHTRFEQNISLELDSNFSLDKARIVLEALSIRYVSMGGEVPIAFLIPLNPGEEVQVLMLEKNHDAYFQVSEIREILGELKEISTNIQLAGSTAQIAAAGLVLYSGGISTPASTAFIGGVQVVKEGAGAVEIVSKYGHLATEFILVYLWGNALAATVEDSNAITRSFMTAVEFMISESQNPVYFHKDHNYDGTVSLDLNLPGDSQILWKMPFVPMGIRNGTVEVNNTGNAAADYRILTSGFWAPGENLGRPLFSLPTCFDGSKTFYLKDSSPPHSESIMYIGYGLGFIGMMDAHHLMVDLYAGPFYVDYDEQSFWVLDSLLFIPFSLGPLATETKLNSKDFMLSTVDAGGYIGYQQIKQEISDYFKLADTFLSATVPTLTTQFSPDPNVHIAKLKLFAPPETLVSILIVDEGGKRLGYSSEDGIFYNELLGMVNNLGQRPISVALFEPSEGTIYTIEVALLSPDNRDVHIEIFYHPTGRSNAMMSALPSSVVLDGHLGSEQTASLRLAEVSAQGALTDVHAIMSSLEAWDGGDEELRIISDPNQAMGDIPAGEQRYVGWEIDYADEVERGKYAGGVTISSNETADLNIPVVAPVRHATETVSFYEGPDPNVATMQKRIELGPEGEGQTWVHVPRGYTVMHAAMGVVGASENLQDPSIDIGADDTTEWAFSGKFDMGVLVNNVEDAFNDYLTGKISEPNGVKVRIVVTGEPNEVVLLNGVQLYLESMPGDFEPDGDVDVADLFSFVSRWLDVDCEEPGWCGRADLDYNGEINFLDFARFAYIYHRRNFE